MLRLQRVLLLLLRGLGLGLPHIAEVLARERDEVGALTTHQSLLTQEQERLSRQIAAVGHTISGLSGKEELMGETMFDGFDHAQYRDEVEERWGARAYAASDTWWRGKDAGEQASWLGEVDRLNSDWQAAAVDPAVSADSAQAQELARRHVAWLQSVPGTPAADAEVDLSAYVTGLCEMYVSDERFAANYGGVEGASFVRDALRAYMS